MVEVMLEVILGDEMLVVEVKVKPTSSSSDVDS